MEGLHLSKVGASPSYGKAAEAYKKAVTVAATAAAYTMVARSMSRELLPDELLAAGRWAVAFVRDRLQPPAKQPRTKTIFISPGDDYSLFNRLYPAARAYLATRIDPHVASRLCLAVRDGDGQILSMVPGDSTADVFEGVKFTWTLVAASRRRRGDDEDIDDGGCGGVFGGGGGVSGAGRQGSGGSLVLSFDAEHTDLALGKYVPFIMAMAEEAVRQRRTLQIFINEVASWRSITHQHPATFDTLAMDPALKQSIIADLDRFLKRKDYYRRIGKGWKRGYLLYGPPGTGKSSMVAAMANYLRFDLYDLDLSMVYNNSMLPGLLKGIASRSILVIEDIDCCNSAASREDDGDGSPSQTQSSSDKAQKRVNITLSGLLNFIDGLWSTSGEERVIVFTTNYKDRLDPALLRPGRMDMHVYMGYCGWEAFKTLARNYFLVDDHALFPEIQELLSGVEVTPAEVSEMLLRSEDADVALQGFMEFLQDKKKGVKA
ncbi:hypothetical protein EJB05_12259, partial [Eragrostis curvula]